MVIARKKFVKLISLCLIVHFKFRYVVMGCVQMERLILCLTQADDFMAQAYVKIVDICNICSV